MTPKKFGRYQIKSELGRGGMATVYQAFDPRFKRDVALKVLPREFLHDPNFHARFEREAQTIASLEHPAIVPVYDFGKEDGQPYLVMRYLAGGSLHDYLQEGGMPLKDVIRIITHLAPAIDEAHQHGIIHRDLKPPNILFDHRRAPYIADFGIAKITTGSKTLTSGEFVIGTPDYMSPEQASGEKVDGRSDIYALGVIMFQMLTGELPFTSETPVGLLMKHITEPVPSILEVNSDLPPGCETVISHALAKDPDERYETAKALALAFSQAPTAKRSPAAKPPPIVVSRSSAESNVQSVSAAPESNVPQNITFTPVSQLHQLTCPNCGAPLPKDVRPNQPIECDSCHSRFIMSAPGQSDTITCPNCETINPQELRYCSNCGQSLKIDCVRCHTQNPIDSPHCVNCGTNLKAAQARRKELLETRQKQREEREKAFAEKEARQRREKVMRLVKELGDPNRQSMAIYQLTQIGGDALPNLIETLLNKNRHSRARASAAKLVGQICDEQDVKGLIKARVAKALIKALTDPEPAVRYWAAEALGKFKGQPGQLAVEPLGQCLKDRNDEVRQQARKSLEKIGGLRAQELLDSSKGFMGWLKGG